MNLKMNIKWGLECLFSDLIKNIFSLLQSDILVLGKKMKVTDRDEDRTAHSLSSWRREFRLFVGSRIFWFSSAQRTGYSGSQRALQPVPLMASIIKPHLAFQKSITLHVWSKKTLNNGKI